MTQDLRCGWAQPGKRSQGTGFRTPHQAIILEKDTHTRLTQSDQSPASTAHTHMDTHPHTDTMQRAPKPLNPLQKKNANGALGSSATHQAFKNKGYIVMKASRLSAVDSGGQTPVALCFTHTHPLTASGSTLHTILCAKHFLAAGRSGLSQMHSFSLLLVIRPGTTPPAFIFQRLCSSVVAVVPEHTIAFEYTPPLLRSTC